MHCKKRKPYLSKESLLTLYHSLIMSHILYCITLWYHGNKSVVGQPQRSVNNYIRLIFNLNPRDSVVEIMKSQKLLSINQPLIKETSKLMFQFFNNGLQSGAYLGGAIGSCLPPPFGSLGLQNCLEKWAKLRHAPFPSLCKLGIRLWALNRLILGEKWDKMWVKTFFFLFSFSFALHLILGEKWDEIWVKNFFFCFALHLIFGE